MTAADASAEELTVAELASATGVSVRTTRYYASLGLLPPPQRRGRVAYYSAAHRGRLELVRALQDHGFTLSAIERYLARIPLDASAEDLAVQRAMLTAWAPGERLTLTARQLERKAGRRLAPAQLEQLVLTGAVAQVGERAYEVLPAFEVGVALLDLDLPLDGLVEAGAAIERHMTALADDLTTVLQRRVLGPYRSGPASGARAVRLEQTLSRLRQLTLEAVVRGFPRAADQVITRSLAEDAAAASGSAPPRRRRARPALPTDSSAVTVSVPRD